MTGTIPRSPAPGGDGSSCAPASPAPTRNPTAATASHRDRGRRGEAGLVRMPAGRLHLRLGRTAPAKNGDRPSRRPHLPRAERRSAGRRRRRRGPADGEQRPAEPTVLSQLHSATKTTGRAVSTEPASEGRPRGGAERRVDGLAASAVRAARAFPGALLRHDLVGRVEDGRRATDDGPGHGPRRKTPSSMPAARRRRSTRG